MPTSMTMNKKRAKPKHYCDDCDETCSSEEHLKSHIERERDDEN